jgi:hypothetical protein
MWGKATVLANGAVLGMTGRRRSSIENFVPFVGDHTLGTSMTGQTEAVSLLRPEFFDDIATFPNGMCKPDISLDNCYLREFIDDPAYFPDGRALVAHNPQPTNVLQGEQLWLNFAAGLTLEERIESLLPEVPKNLGISLIDRGGVTRRLIDPPAGRMLRFPAWVGKRSPPRVQEWRTDEAVGWTELHIADVPLWFSFVERPFNSTNKSSHMTQLDEIVSLRVHVKETVGNACLTDGRPYRYSVNNGYYDHPTHLGIVNATGFDRFKVPIANGGDAYGDVPLALDKSVRLRVPAGKLLLFQGIDADGHVVKQRSRVTALSPGQVINTSVKRAQYRSQCESCHGAILPGQVFADLDDILTVPFEPLDFDTQSQVAVDLTVPAVEQQAATFLHTVRPILEAPRAGGSCVSCHTTAGDTQVPAGELSLDAEYSATGNYPAGKWASQAYLHDPAYVAWWADLQANTGAVPVPSYNYSVAYDWMMRQDHNEYKASAEFGPLFDSHAPLADLAPWDPGYQNLYARDELDGYLYLSNWGHPSFGRSSRFRGNSRDSWLIEILSGRDINDRRDFTGSTDHTGMLSEQEVRDLMAVIDVGFPFMSSCEDVTLTSGPNAGQGYGDGEVSEF